MRTLCLCLLLPTLAFAAGPPVERWVDASAAAGGDGSAAKPLRSVSEALQGDPQALRVHLATGLYVGPSFTLPPHCELLGKGTVVLSLSGVEPVLRSSGFLRVQGVHLQGGGWGVEAQGQVELEKVSLSGQRKGGVWMRQGSLRAEGLRLEAHVSGLSGVLMEPETELWLQGGSFEGPWRRAVELRKARAELAALQFRGPVTALHQVGGKVSLRRAEVLEGRGPGVFVARGSLTLHQVQVVGQEYGLQSASGAQLVIRDFTSMRAERAGLALVESEADVEDLQVLDSGSSGAVQLVRSTARMRRFWLDSSRETGLSAMASKVWARGGVISRTREGEGKEGHGIQLRRVEGDLEGVFIVQCAGVGVLAAEGTRLSLRDASVSGCQQGGVVSDSQAEVRLSSVDIRDGGAPALIVPGPARLDADVLSARHNAQGLLWAECGAGAQVKLGRVFASEVDSAGRQSPCVE